LGQKNVEERGDYIIIYNLDFFFHDIRERFDPAGGGGLLGIARTRTSEANGRSDDPQRDERVDWRSALCDN
jgi:hypothetical protein